MSLHYDCDKLQTLSLFLPAQSQLAACAQALEPERPCILPLTRVIIDLYLDLLHHCFSRLDHALMAHHNLFPHDITNPRAVPKWDEILLIAVLVATPPALWLFATNLVNTYKSEELLSNVMLIAERARGHYAAHGFPPYPERAEAFFISNNIIPKTLVADSAAGKLADPWGNALTITYTRPRYRDRVKLILSTSLDRSTCRSVVSKAVYLLSQSTFSLRIANKQFSEPPRDHALSTLCHNRNPQVSFEIALAATTIP